MLYLDAREVGGEVVLEGGKYVLGKWEVGVTSDVWGWDGESL